MYKVKKVGIVVANSDFAKETANKVELQLVRRGIRIGEKFLVGEKKKRKFSGCDIVLVFGGDGTILKASHMINEPISIFGINCGESSFLMDVDATNVFDYLPLILDKRFTVEERTRLILDPELPFALNEIVIAPSKPTILMNYALRVDEDHLWRDSGDGVLIATSTGSTAYNLSAGGPILTHNSHALAITPINSLKKTAPLIAGDKSKLTIYNISAPTDCEAVIDGSFRMKIKDKVVIKKAPQPTLLARIRKSSYVASKAHITKVSALSKVKLERGPPAAKFILKMLELERSMTQKELINATQLPPRTIRRALAFLMKNKLIMKNPSIGDFRQDIYIYNVKS